jgi:hypothetical protein
VGKPERRDYYEDQDVGVGCGDVVMWTGLVWLRIGTGGELS